MAVALNDKYLVVGQPDGFTDANVVRSRVFKQTVTNYGTVNEGDTLEQGESYAVAKFPPGFVPRSAVVNVIEPNAASATVTVQFAENATDLKNATLEVVKTGEGASQANLNAKGQTLIDVSAPFVTGENAYLVLSAGAAVDAKFEVVVCGDWPELTGVEHLPKLA